MWLDGDVAMNFNNPLRYFGQRASMIQSEQQLPTDEPLPPVDPPSAGFIFQLFIVPALIILVIIGLWLMFSWLAHVGENWQSYTERLKKRDWQAANNLAEALRNAERNSDLELIENEDLAYELVQILEKELEDGEMDPKSILFRRYLCSALGYFHLETGLGVLIEAAQTHRNKKEIPVRYVALQAIVHLASNFLKEDPPKTLSHPRLIEMLIEVADDESQWIQEADEKNRWAEGKKPIREPAIFALGIFGSDEALEKLESLLTHESPNVRFNAATGLARHGKAKCLEVLLEMFDPDVVNEEKDEQPQIIRRDMIHLTALQAAGKLVDKNQDVDLSSLVKAIETLKASEKNREMPNPHVISKSDQLLKRLKNRPSAVGAGK